MLSSFIFSVVQNYLFLPYFRFKFEIFFIDFLRICFSGRKLSEKKYSSSDDEEEEVGNTEPFFRIFVGFLIEKSMFPNVYLFNPDYDMAMANFTPYYKSPAEIMRMIADLSVLPWWFAEEGNCVKVENMALVSLLQKQLREVCGGSMEVERRLEGLLPRTAWTAEWPSACYIPWGWTPALVHWLRQKGVEERFLPSEDVVKRFRFLSSRQRCLEVLPELVKIAETCGEMKACMSLSELEAFLQERGELVLKAPWSGSGRGLLKVSSTSWNAQLAGWAARILRVQGVVMAEPIYDKVIDFAMEFYVEKQNGVRFAGYSLFETDAHGNYKLNLLLSNTEIENRLSAYVSREVLHEVRICLLSALQQLLKDDYEGYLGVDMMICRVAEEFVVHPCVEINLRMNMGVVSRLFFDRYVSSSSSGQYVVEHYAAEGEALENHHRCLSAYPLKIAQDGRILQGYLPLTPVQATTHYQVYVVVNNTGL